MQQVSLSRIERQVNQNLQTIRIHVGRSSFRVSCKRSSKLQSFKGFMMLSGFVFVEIINDVCY
jgi:hypothetical protein